MDELSTANECLKEAHDNQEQDYNEMILALNQREIGLIFLPFGEEEEFEILEEEPIGEEEEFEIVEEENTEGKGHPLASDVAEADLKKTRARTAVLAHEAESNIMALQHLLGKTSTGIATRAEKDRLLSLNSKLSALKADIKEAKTIEKDTEIKFLKATARSKVAEIMLAMKEKDIRRALHAIQFAESVDVAFIVDCTGSMAPYISSVKDSIKSIVDRVLATNQDTNLRLAIVGYRDINDSPRCEVLDFVTSIDSFKEFLAGLNATGGDDTPEDMANAIRETNKLSWANPSKVTFIIADAPCHGSEFHSCDDSYPHGTPGIDIVSELRVLQKLGGQSCMSITFGRITSQTDLMINRFQSHYGCVIVQVGIEEARKLTKTVTASVRKSIFKTVTIMGKPRATVAFETISSIEGLLETSCKPSRISASLKEYTISDELPKWKEQPYSKVKVYRNMQVKNLADLQNPLRMGVLRFLPKAHQKHRTEKMSESTMLMRRASSPFAEGEVRLAYHGQLAKEDKDLVKDGHSMVMKSFKHLGKGVNDRDQYLKQMEVSAIAHFLAVEYNKSSSKPSRCFGIKVLPVIVVEEVDEKNESTGNRRFCTEHHLPTGGSAFAKYSNNTGYWDEDTLDETLLRFTKFTHDATDGYIIVTDLQGVCKGNAYHLTDPVILCKDILRFGNTNLGEKFIKKCIDSTQAHLEENGWM
jgi:hypothetical protein